MLELQRVGSNCRDIAGELHRAQQEITTGGGHQRAEELEQELARAASRSGVMCRICQLLLTSCWSFCCLMQFLE